MLKNVVLSLSVAVLFAGCASAPENVVPLPKGEYEVTSTGATKSDALKAALGDAKTTCKAKKMRHVVLSQTDSYKGVVSEDTNQKIDTAARVFAAISKTRLPGLSGGDDYSSKLVFTCEQ